MDRKEKLEYLTHQLEALVRQAKRAQGNVAEQFGQELHDCTYMLEWLEGPAPKLYAGSMAESILKSLADEDTLEAKEEVAKGWFERLTESLLTGHDSRPSSTSMFHNAAMVQKQEAIREVRNALHWGM